MSVWLYNYLNQAVKWDKDVFISDILHTNTAMFITDSDKEILITIYYELN